MQDTAAAKNDVKTIGHWIDGQVQPGSAARHGVVHDPATGEVTGRLQFADAATVDAALTAAAQALPAWRAYIRSIRTPIASIPAECISRLLVGGSPQAAGNTSCAAPGSRI